MKNYEEHHLPSFLYQREGVTAVKEVPQYLEEYYWWAYVRPWAARLFDYQLVVNFILFGNYNRLRNLALEELGADLSGRTLQVGCCYGNLTPHLAERVARSGGTLDVIDILPMQLENLGKKIRPGEPINLFLMDAAALDMPDATYGHVIIFLLLHEQPQAYRERTLHEALRVLKPGGKIVVIDYGRPALWHPARFTTIPIYSQLKPYAVDVWNNGLEKILPEMAGSDWRKKSYFGGLFQKLVSTERLL